MKRDRLTDELRGKAVILELIAGYLEGCMSGLAPLAQEEDLSQLAIVLDYIEQHLSRHLTVEELASQVYLHPNYFIPYFRSMTGYTPIHYVNQRKMNYARKLLESGDYAVQEAALAVGLPNHYFSRMFKQFIGMAPRRYRQLMEESRAAAAAEDKQVLTPPELMQRGGSQWNEEFGWMEDRIPSRLQPAQLSWYCSGAEARAPRKER